jgi:hypothetical protein
VILQLADGSQKRYPNHAAFVLIGADPPVTWLEKLGVRFVCGRTSTRWARCRLGAKIIPAARLVGRSTGSSAAVQRGIDRLDGSGPRRTTSVDRRPRYTTARARGGRAGDQPGPGARAQHSVMAVLHTHSKDGKDRTGSVPRLPAPPVAGVPDAHARGRVVGTDTIAQVPNADELAATRSLPRVTGAPRQPADLAAPPRPRAPAPPPPPRRATPRTMAATDSVTAVQAPPAEFDDGPTQLGWTGERRS